MPDFPRLLLMGSYGLECSVGFDIIVQNLGDGYGNRLRTGSKTGTPGWKLIYDVLPDTLDGGIDTATGVISRAKYLWEFFCERMTEASGSFIITDPRTGKDYLAGFKDTKITYRMFAIKLFSTGLELEYRREPGVPTLEDGSLGAMENPASI